MTICVYKNGILAADSLATIGTTAVSFSFKKIGMIFEDALTGERALDPELLDFPEEFAMYAIAGSASESDKFLRWFINKDHPVIDHYDSFEKTTTDSVDSFVSLIIFKNSDIIRRYEDDYQLDKFIDVTKSSFMAIGCGYLAAIAINNYDADASSADIVSSVMQIDIACGGNVNTLSFSTKEYYTKESLKSTCKIIIRNKTSFWQKFKNIFKK